MSEIPFCGERMLAGHPWLCDLATGHEGAHYSSEQDLGASPFDLGAVLTTTGPVPVQMPDGVDENTRLDIPESWDVGELKVVKL